MSTSHPDALGPSALGSLRALGAVVAHAPRLAQVSASAARAHGGGRIAAVRRLRRLRRAGFAYEEALRDGLLDPAISEAELAGYASRHVALIVQARVNPESLTPLTTEKALFYRHCEAIGLPVPELLAIVDRRAAGWGRPGRLLRDEVDFAELVADLPEGLVVKPSAGGRGVGVRVLRRRGRLLADVGGSGELTPEALWGELRADPEFECFVVQERLRNHPELAAAVPSEALHTVRVATFVPRSGPPEVSQAVIRLGIGGGVTDNFGDGADGNGYAEVRAKDGRMGPLRMSRPDGCGFVELQAVPGTGAPIEGLCVPFWQQARELAFRASRHFLPSRSIGWDIAITDRGPVLVEANRCWAPFPQPDLARTLERIGRA